MAYVPPAPGTTIPGQPTPEGVPKQDAHIADLPPEVRKSFLLSMVFFPSLVGATICLVIFLGYWTVFKTKEPQQFARELSTNDPRRRWSAARELAESIPPADPNPSAPKNRIYDPVVLTALINILENKELDKEAEAWSPTAMIKKDDEGSRIRWWAAPMVGHFASRMDDRIDRKRGLQALLQALQEKDLAMFAAKGLSLLKDPAAREPLAVILQDTNQDPAVQAAAANAMGAIGEYALLQKFYALKEAGKTPAKWDEIYSFDRELEKFRQPLRDAFEHIKDPTVLDNVAVALARLRDPAGRARLQELLKHSDSVVRDHAERALSTLDMLPPKS